MNNNNNNNRIEEPAIPNIVEVNKYYYLYIYIYINFFREDTRIQILKDGLQIKTS